MPKLCANLSLLYTELDFMDRFAAAAKSGFKGIEYLFPYAYPKDQLAEALARNKLVQVLHNMPAGDWTKGDRGMACQPGREGEFQDGVGKAIEYATALGCKQVNCLAGLAPQGVAPEKLRATFVANLKFAAEKTKAAGIRLVTEPVNNRDVPGFYLNRSQQALEIMDEVGSDNLWLQYDIYHMQIMEGNLARTIEANLARINHMQLADNPGRHEPGTGEINYPFLFGWIDRIGYPGWIGCEYNPQAGTVPGLGWAKPHL
jgi:hydroxypyruvate isomerase